MRKKESDLEKELDERSRESGHLKSLVAKMEASASQDEAVKTELADLKQELASAEGKQRWHYQIFFLS